MSVVKNTPFRKTGLVRVLQASRFSYQGLKWLALNEPAFRQELLLFVLLIAVSFSLNVTPLQQLILVVPLLLVLLVEVLNTAIEAAIDRISSDIHPLSGLAKDLGSAAVTISLLIAALCWFVILFWG